MVKNIYTETETYKCAFCGIRNRKLYKPQTCTILVCSSCAEARQSEIKYPEYVYQEGPDGYRGVPTGEMLTMSRWKVDDEGRIPQVHFIDSGVEPIMVNNLPIDIKGQNSSFSIKGMVLIPAILDGSGRVLDKYSAIPEIYFNMWKNLPTH
jgi:hypothetical protein